MATLDIVFGSLTVISLGIAVWQHLVARRFPLHQRATAIAEFPPVSLLKPMKGVDAHTVDCLVSWLRQNYPAPVQILCGVSSAEDPACRVVEKLQKLHPNADLQLVICSADAGRNPKVSKLAQLEPHIAHPIVVVSDADVWAQEDYLRQAVATLRGKSVGLVHSLYRLHEAPNAATALEAIGTNCDMWTQVLQACSMGEIHFALGAAMTLRRETLQRIGGFAALANHLADDHRLGALIHATGDKIALTNAVVECRCEPLNWQRFWRHQIRWNTTIRVCEPVPYFFSIIANLTLWPVAWVVATVGSTPALIGLALCLITRLGTASRHWHRIIQQPMPASRCLLVPLKDLIQVAFWGAAFLTSTIEWRGTRYRIHKDGTLAEFVPVQAAEARTESGLV
jgi:ceramide glucosyltransferase